MHKFAQIITETRHAVIWTLFTNKCIMVDATGSSGWHVANSDIVVVHLLSFLSLEDSQPAGLA